MLSNNKILIFLQIIIDVYQILISIKIVLFS